ncbi:hypothetical protein [Leptolyngbya sp. FACHB-16]|uniref:hypothetical protein n=1 Tax=unclassified Leptolyngbya TaxID=2650499 RepID=UPI0016862929|nr:hypothetical protein [Leptolyngbya sp. FACHB-16]MBD2157029.1 hypothetical protein [Leptolyngbya sp. FACHB-16]
MASFQPSSYSSKLSRRSLLVGGTALTAGLLTQAQRGRAQTGAAQPVQTTRRTLRGISFISQPLI